MKRLVAVLACSLAAVALTSCATFNRNAVAARAGHNELTQKAAQRLIKDADPANTGAQMRAQLTSWIRLAAVADSKGLTLDGLDQQNRIEYEKGLAGNGPVCAQAIVVTNMGATAPVIDALNSGTSFNDAFTQFNQLQDLIPTGGVIQGPDGSDCLAASILPKDLADALKTGTVGQPFAYDFTTFAAVLLLRPYADVRTPVALSGLTELEVAQALKDSGVWVDSRYGAWNPESQAVEPLRS